MAMTQKVNPDNSYNDTLQNTKYASFGNFLFNFENLYCFKWPNVEK